MIIAFGLMIWGRSRRQELLFYAYAAAAWAWWIGVALLETNLIMPAIQKGGSDHGRIEIAVGLTGVAVAYVGVKRLIGAGYRAPVPVVSPQVDVILANWEMGSDELLLSIAS